MKHFVFISFLILIVSCKTDTKSNNENETTVSKNSNPTSRPVEITPISHATFVMAWEDEVLYVDPVGGADIFNDMPSPTLVLITDIHGDHFNIETLEGLTQPFDIVAPKAVYDKMPNDLKNSTKILGNGQSFKFHGFKIEGIPMYNITEERKKYHEKGRGNGYVLSRDDYKVYISGDTENIPEMNNLKDIDLAFLCMNLPYTMSVETAVEATLSFQPNTIIPYHYRGMKDEKRHIFDVEKFKDLINSKSKNIKVELLNWYPSN